MPTDAAPQQILLVGPRVAHLAPFFQKRGYAIEAHERGSAGVSAMEARLRDLVVLELNLSDYSAPDFLALARGVQPETRFLLLDDATRAGQIVKAMQAGAHGYVATPPDETRLFGEVDRLLGAAPRAQRNAEDLRQEVEDARTQAATAAMQVDLVQQELTGLREQLDAARADLEKAHAELEQARTQSAGAPDEAELAALKEAAEELEEARARLALQEDERLELEEQVKALEADVERLRSAEARSATLAASEVDLQARVEELERQLAEAGEAGNAAEEGKTRLLADLDKLRADVAAAQQEAREADARAAELARRLEETEQKIAAADTATRDAAAAKAAAEKAAEEARAAVAAAQARVTAAEARADTEAARVKKELEDQIAKALAFRDAAEEKYLEREIEVDALMAELKEARQQIEAERQNLVKAEKGWKKEKLRLVEEKEAAGSAEAYRKMEAMVDELSRLRQLKLAYEERYGALPDPPG